MFDNRAEAGAHPISVNDIDLQSKKIFECANQPGVVEQRSPRLEADNQIKIGGFCGVAARDGSEDSDIRCPVSPCNVENHISLLLDRFPSNHLNIVTDDEMGRKGECS